MTLCLRPRSPRWRNQLRSPMARTASACSTPRAAMRLLAKDPDARTEAEDASVRAAVAGLVEEARGLAPDAAYRDVIAEVLDYRSWHELKIYVRRPGRPDELLRRRTTLSEGEKKLVTYLPMAAAAAASAAAQDPHGAGFPAADPARRRVRQGLRGQPRAPVRAARRSGPGLHRHQRAAVRHARQRSGAVDRRGAARPGPAHHRARALPLGRASPDRAHR